jgi:hypothetical protein
VTSKIKGKDTFPKTKMTTQTNKNTAEDKVKIKTMNHGAYNSS